MPILKSISIHATVERSLAYILNPEKTNDLIYTNAMNCIPDPKCAYLAMKLVYEQFSGYKFDEPVPKSGKGHVKAIHYIQSFDPKDGISPELAHRIGRTFARKAFGDNCQVVIATHIDRQHVHNHILINTYGIDGRKFNDNLTTRKNLREISDRVYLVFGIKPIEPQQGSSSIDHSEWEHKQRGTSWKEKIREDIDGLVGCVKNVDELLAESECLGYTVKRGKYISVRVPEHQRAVRLKTLGEDYTVEQLASRILWRDVGAGINYPCKESALRDTYNSSIAEMQRINDSRPDLQKLSAMLAVINRDRLQSIGEVEGKIRTIEYELEKARHEVNSMETKCNFLKALAEQSEKYFSLMDKPLLTDEERLRAEMYRTALAQQNIENVSDYEYLKDIISETEQKAAPIKVYHNKCAELLREYTDISETYKIISRKDYISNLIKQQKKQVISLKKPRQR